MVQESGDLTVSASVAPTSMQTYIDIAHGNLSPPQLTVSLPITVGPNSLVSPKIVLPLDFIPDNSTAEYQYFTDPGTVASGTLGKPFFTFDASGQPAHAWISGYNVVDSGFGYDNLEIRLDGNKMNSGDFQTISVLFDFNDDYLSKVPANTRMWTVHPQAVVDGTVTGSVDAATGPQVKGASKAVFGGASTIYRDPANSIYMSGPITARARLQSNAPYQNTFDDSNDNIVYIEVPTGSTIGTPWLNYFKDGGPVASTNHPGYTRYYRYIHADNYTAADGTKDWTYWQYGGNVDQNFFQVDSTFTPPTMADGTAFNFYIGAEVKRVNSGVIKDEWSLAYTKTAEPAFNLYLIAHHGGTGSGQSIANTADGSVGTYYMYAGMYGYISNNSIKNAGSGPINNVKMVLYQASDNSSKVNFNNIVVYGDRRDDSVDFTRYKAEVVVKNALTSVTSTVAAGQSPATGDPDFTLTLPTLNANEYFDQVIVTPMGTNGATNGVLTHHNSLSIGYRIKSWTGQKWPDGTTNVPDYSAIPMEWKLYYDDASAAAQVFQGNSCNSYYVKNTAVNAKASFVSSTAGAALPGTNVGYQILGYNDEVHALSDWNDPRIAVRVPKEMTLVGVGGTHTITGLTGALLTAQMTSRLIGSDGSYNYYEFTMASGETFSAPRAAASTAVFSVPIQFAVAPTASATKTYAAPYVVISQGDAANFLYVPNAMNNLSVGVAANYGFGSGENYYAYGIAGSNALTVLSKGNASSKTEVRSAATGNVWASQATVPAEKNTTVEIAVTIQNSGNTTLSALKLYELLPFNGDTPGSFGDVELLSVSAASGTQPTVYYTDTAYASLPKYGTHGGTTVDLQDGAFTGGYGWSTTKPGTPTATYVDFGTRTLAPGASIQMILTFKIPNAAGNAIVKNQFAYSAVDGSTSSTIKLNSDLITMTTEAIAITYEGNEPTTTAGTDVAGGIPAAQNGTQGVTQNFTIPSDIPTLRGHTFANWSTTPTGSGTNYAPGDTVPAPTSGTTVLYARWTENDNYTVTYDTNGATSISDKTSVSWTGAGLLPASNPTKDGYTFVQWNMLGGTGKTNVGAADTYKSLVSDGTEPASITLQAQWAGKDVAVSYYYNGADNTTPYTNQNAASDPASLDVSGTYGGTLANTPAPVPTRDGYTFGGWFPAPPNADSQWYFGPGGTALTMTAGVENAATSPTLKLYAKWTLETYNISYNLGGGSVSAANPATYTVLSTPVTINAPTKDGYDFAGWTVEYANSAITNVDTADENYSAVPKYYTGTTLTTGNIALTAHWSPTNYSISYNLGGGSVSAANPANYTVESPFPIDISNAPTRPGYDFGGWTVDYANPAITDVTTAVMSYSVLQYYTGSTPTTGNITLTANWSERTDYKVEYDTQGGQPPTITEKTGVKFADDALLPSDTMTREGYTFEGWYTQANGAGTKVESTTAYSTLVANDNVLSVKLYADWAPRTVDIKYYSGDGSNNGPGSEIPNTSDSTKKFAEIATLPTPPTLTGATFIGWDTSPAGYNPLTIITAPTLAVTTASGVVDYSPKTAAGNATLNLYAKWAARSVDVTYNTNGGTGLAGETLSGTYGGKLSPAPTTQPGKTGYTFEGWYFGSSLATYQEFKFGTTTLDTTHGVSDFAGAPAAGNATLTLYAKWTANTGITLNFNANGGVAGTTQTKPVTYDAAVGKLPGTGSGAPTRTGYTFEGWSTSRGASNTVNFTSSYIVDFTSSKTVYAVWEIKTYTVTYIGNGHTSGVAPAVTTHGHGSNATVKTQETLVRDSHSFSGWNTAADGSGSAYAAGSAISNITGNQTLYAQWTYNTPPTDPPDDPDDPDDPPRRPEDPDDPPVDPPEPPVVPPADPPAPPTTETEIRPSEDTPAPAEPVAAPAATEGFSEGDQVKL
ncbi:MAG: InlB B-repeat-containing protein, partial [Clostridiales Family XIII bacterium]|nr:InlB B-repeat-containing protein [Clostridiales Family XIII bacterium]